MNSPKAGFDAPASGLLIRSAVAEDADGIDRTFLESAQHHASLDPARYVVPSTTEIVARYRDGQQHPPEAAAITLVAEIGGAIVGFVDARLDRSTDPMHRELVYCVIAEIAVSQQCQGQGVGRRLLEETEAWGREHGADFASLEYLAVNTRANNFYQRRMGYQTAHVTAIKRL
jgi:ribosomal protein S18 acetylase RimI-like enzyme